MHIQYLLGLLLGETALSKTKMDYGGVILTWKNIVVAVLIVTLYLCNNTPIDDCKGFVFIHLGTFAPKFSEEYTVVPEEGRNAITIILAGDFNIELKKKEMNLL
jgi:hypothetical protein